jgi:hypothetical protein
MYRTLRTLTAVAAAAVAVGGAQAQTMIGGGKTALTFPIQITQSGSYKLAGNLNVPANTSGIVIGAGLRVSLDLGGYQIKGAMSCSKNGCTSSESTSGIEMYTNSVTTVSNGAISGFRFGVLANTTTANVDGLTLTGNWQAYNGQQGATIARRMIVSDNVHGFAIQRGVISESLALNNGATGIYVALGTIRDSHAFNNGAYGFYLPSGVADGLTGSQNSSGYVVNTSGGNNQLN